MTSDLFHGAILKMERAQQHIKEVEAIILAYSKSKSFRLCAEEDATDGMTLLYLRVHKCLPGDDLALIIGDAIHNLWSALDHLVFAILEPQGVDPKQIYFPVSNTLAEFNENRRMKKIECACPKLGDLIREQVKPYEEGNNLLWTLNQLDIIDKHRLIIPTVVFSGLEEFSVISNDVGVYFINNGVSMEGEGCLNIARVRGKLKITNKGRPIVDVRFGKDTPCEGKSVAAELKEIAKKVSETIDLFSAYAQNSE